ncbi:hypothetical protein MUK42_25767, partial [Musa troglodytarum]
HQSVGDSKREKATKRQQGGPSYPFGWSLPETARVCVFTLRSEKGGRRGRRRRGGGWDERSLREKKLLVFPNHLRMITAEFSPLMAAKYGLLLVAIFSS